MKKITLILISILFLASQCKREKDTITTQDIKGMVFNNCTDSGLANVTVYLSDGQGLNTSTQSDANGNFIFTNTKIHSNTKYKYTLNIPSKSGINATTFEYCGFNGDLITFNNESILDKFILNVVPKYLVLNLSCNKTPLTNSNDSVKFLLSNNTLHKNSPSLPFKFGGGGFYGNLNYNIGNIGNYPMGKYNIEIEMWKSGVYSTKKDSVYLAWGAIKSYTINW